MAIYKDGGRTLTIETYDGTTMVRISPVGSWNSREMHVPLSVLKEMVNAQ